MLQPLLKTAIFLIVLCTPLGCKRMATFERQGYVLGPSDDIERYSDSDQANEPTPRSAAQSSVLIVTQYGNQRRYCSGTLVAKSRDSNTNYMRVLTNFHCFADTDEAGTVQNEFKKDACANTRVLWGVGIPDQTEQSAGCAEGTLSGNRDADLAAFSLNAEFQGEARTARLGSDNDLVDNTAAMLVHYPDIKENYIVTKTKPSLRVPSASITSRDCLVLGLFSADEAVLDPVLPYSFKHECDLEHGSSGSGVFDARNATLIGVNWGGLEIKTQGVAQRTNAAIRMNIVRSFLDGNSDALLAKTDDKPSDASSEKQEGRADRFGKNMGCSSIAVNDSSHPNSAFFDFLTLIFLLTIVPWVANRKDPTAL